MARDRVGAVASVVDAGDPANLQRVLGDLHARGIGQLMVEGGGTMHTQFLEVGLTDELHLVIAPFFVGDAQAPHFVRDGRFPWNADHRARLPKLRRSATSSCSSTPCQIDMTGNDHGTAGSIRR
jgi:5-amino-6-(5-phosphoribosylamino)uracil reductase